MTPLSQLECCTLLGIDPKTLCQWMRQAHRQFASHPTDARLKQRIDFADGTGYDVIYTSALLAKLFPAAQILGIG